MKRKGRKAGALQPAEITATFTRGMVTAGLLTAVQERWSAGVVAPPRRKVLRYALQGGAALAAGSAAADAIRNRDYATAALALAAGAAGLVVLEHLLNPAGNPASEEKNLG